MIEEIKRIVENYLGNRNLARIVPAAYTGGRMVLDAKSYVPMEMVSGTLKEALREGDRVLLLRNDGGREYYIIEISGLKPFLIGRNTCADSTGYNCDIN